MNAQRLYSILQALGGTQNANTKTQIFRMIWMFLWPTFILCAALGWSGGARSFTRSMCGWLIIHPWRVWRRQTSIGPAADQKEELLNGKPVLVHHACRLYSKGPQFVVFNWKQDFQVCNCRSCRCAPYIWSLCVSSLETHGASLPEQVPPSLGGVHICDQQVRDLSFGVSEPLQCIIGPS